MTNREEDLNRSLRKMRQIVGSPKKKRVIQPLGVVQKKDPTLKGYELDKWVNGQNPHLKVKATKITDTEIYADFQISHECDLGVHSHPGWIEEVILYHGVYQDKITGDTVRSGIKYKYPSGQAHNPVFLGPSEGKVIFRKAAGV